MDKEELTDIAVACGFMCRPSNRKGTPTKLKWWWIPVIAVWIYIIYCVTSKLLAGVHRI